jgi:hypothetical protein
VCQVANCSYEHPFGGSHVILLGDFTQLGPVRVGPSLTQAVMDIHASEFVKTWLRKRSKKSRGRESMIPSKDQAENKYLANHPY